MHILITGGAGFLGSRLARTLLKKSTLNHQTITRLTLMDQFLIPLDLQADPRVECKTGTLLELEPWLKKTPLDGVFHLASAVSGECEADFDLGLNSNLKSTMGLLEALRHQQKPGKALTRLVFSSSIAVYGPDASVALPDTVSESTLTTPQTSYGVHKLMCEHLIADYSRKGLIDARSVRLMTVCVRPGKPNGAASSFFSAIIREPLAGTASVCPVDASVSHPVASPESAVQGLIRVFECSPEQLGGRIAVNMPAMNVTVQEMLDALTRVAGERVRRLVTFKEDPVISGIVARWPKAVRANRAASLGLQVEKTFDDIIHQYIHDAINDNIDHNTSDKANKSANPLALQGLNPSVLKTFLAKHTP